MKEECHAASAGGSAGGGGDDDGDGNATINKPSNSSATATNFDQQAKPFRPTPQSTNHPTDQPNNQVRPTSLTSSNNLTTNQPTIQPISQATNFGQQAKAFLPTSKPLYFTLLYSPLQESTPLRIGGSTRLRRLSIFKSQGMTY